MLNHAVPVANAPALLIPPINNMPAPSMGGRMQHLQGETMGTSWQLKLLSSRSALQMQDLLRGLQAQLAMVVAQMSHWHSESCLSRFNVAPAGSWHCLPQPFFQVLQQALHIAQLSDGAFDPAAGALINLWGFGPGLPCQQDGFAIPQASAIAAALAAPGWRDLQLDVPTQQVCQPGGVQLDFSAIAKGFSVDLLSEYLVQQGEQHFLLEIGGELYGQGMKPDRSPWWVALENPPQDVASAAPDRAALHQLALAGSGDYQRFFSIAGRRYAHTIDPRSGWPLDTSLAAVHVLHPQCMLADAWSTALYVLGQQAGMALADRLQIAARFTERKHGVLLYHYSAACRKMMED